METLNPNISYAALLIPNIPFFPDFEETIHFSPHTILIKSKLSNFLKDSNSNSWEKIIGSIEWEAINEDMLMIVSTATIEPSIPLDQELFRIYDILTLVAPFLPPVDQPFLITGIGSIENSKTVFNDFSTITRLDVWTRSYYSENTENVLLEWEFNTLSNPALLETWVCLYQKFNEALCNEHKYVYLIESYRSFRESFYSYHLEFKIPNLVRAIESLIALDRANQGVNNFVARTFSLIKDMPKTPLLNMNEVFLKEDLKEVYYVRNDCSHGKRITDSLTTMEKYSEGISNSHVAVLEMLSEFAARYILSNVIMGHVIKEYCHSRPELETAWSSGVITQD